MASLCLRIARPLAGSAARRPRHAFSASALRSLATAAPTTPTLHARVPVDIVEPEEGVLVDEILAEEAEEDVLDDVLEDDGPPTAPPTSFPKTSPTRNPVTFSTNAKPEDNTVQHRLHVTCTRNNTLITLANEKGEPVPRGVWTGGSCGFKGVNRSGYEAGYQCVIRAFARMKEIGEQIPDARLEVVFKGAGHGRDATFKALMTSEGDAVRPLVNRVTDATPIKIGGTRAKKMRR